MAKRRRAEILYDCLLRSLASREWLPGDRLPTTRVLAERYGSSHTNMLAAIGVAAAGGFLSVKPRKSITVMPQATELARRLLRQRAENPSVRRLALLFPDVYGPNARSVLFFGRLQAAIEIEALRVGIEAEAVTWPLVDQVPFALQLPNRGFGAAFTLGARAMYLPSICALRQQRFPLVLLNAQTPEMPLPSVNMDEYAAMRQLGERLAGLGHRNMCLVTLAVDTRLKMQQHRVFAWRDFLAETGLVDDCTIPVCCIPPRPGAVLHYVRQILAMPPRPTALVFAYGVLCEPFLKMTPPEGLRVPGDVSIATFDMPQAERVGAWCPPPTSIVPDMTRMAQCVVEMTERLLVGDVDPPSIRVPMRIEMTDSIGRVSG